MSRTDTRQEDAECTTTGSFGDHGIDDGSALVHQTHYLLIDGGWTAFEPTESFYDALESAFRWSYLGSAAATVVPAHVEAAINDARALTAAEFAERPDADLRTEVLPTFYQHVAGFHCAYRG